MTALDVEEKHLRRRSAPIPPFVSQRLSTLQTEIISSLIREGAGAVLGNSSHAPSVPSVSAVSPNAFTENLERMAKYYFDQGGKLFRPTVALLMADACNQIVQPKRYTRPGQEVCHNQYKIAMIAEMIHTASLVHDDVIDESDKRRGTPTVNAVWGNKMAVLVGDFILARATQVLCSIGRPPVISTMAEIIEDLVKGEFMQLTSVDGAARERLTHYLTKTFRKTASLFAHSCRAAAMLSDGTETAENRAFAYGRHLGVAFQLIDDLLDFVASSDELGKPVANDLKLGLATAPVLFAAQEHPQLEAMMARRFSIEGDPNAARQLVLDSRGLVRTRELAKEHAHAAAKLAEELPNGDGVSDVLVELALSQLDRSC